LSLRTLARVIFNLEARSRIDDGLRFKRLDISLALSPDRAMSRNRSSSSGVQRKSRRLGGIMMLGY
jgi:hypothetical protein